MHRLAFYVNCFVTESAVYLEVVEVAVVVRSDGPGLLINATLKQVLLAICQDFFQKLTNFDNDIVFRTLNNLLPFCAMQNESMEATKESEFHMHEQLKKKINRLTTSIRRQQAQLEKINNMMSVVRPKMMFSDGLKRQQEQEQQIYDCLSTTVLEQRKQCNRLKTVLDGKMKINETKRRAMELRGKAKTQKQISVERSAGNQSVISDPSPGPSKEMIPNLPLPSPESQNINYSMLSPTFPRHKSPLQGKVLEDSTTRTSVMPNDYGDALRCNVEPPGQHSLQKQLQYLQHQQDVLNAQGMALAAQGGMSGAQLQVFQSFMEQHRALLPTLTSTSSSNTESLVQPGSRSGC